jgi:hypothetical protein
LWVLAMTDAPRVHELKTWSEHFVDLLSGKKTFEFRRNDRDFKVGDTLVLREWSPRVERYSGEQMRLTVSHMLAGPAFGIPEGYVILSLRTPAQEAGDVRSVVPDWAACVECGAMRREHGPDCSPTGLTLPDVDTLAQIIRTVDGNHDLGAGALAEAILRNLAARGK